MTKKNWIVIRGEVIENGRMVINIMEIGHKIIKDMREIFWVTSEIRGERTSYRDAFLRRV